MYHQELTTGIPGHGDPRRRRAAFTLVELLAAMGVFTILMLMLFSFLSSAQRVWTATDSNTRIYENARVAMDLLTRDLQCAVADSRTGQKIPFYVGVTGNGDKLAFVARVEGTATAKADLAEIAYSWTSATDPVGTSEVNKKQYWLRRSRVCDSASSDWDFYNKADNTWVATGQDMQRVVSGVEGVSFSCLNATGPIGAGTTVNVLPVAVTVTLTLFDDKLTNAPTQVRDKTRRTFTKTIFTGARE